MTYLLLFFEFYKMGALTFGGGYAMIPFMEETVLRNNWMTMPEFIDFIAVSESTPGAFAVNMATYIGSEVGGLFGAFCATLGLALPPFVIILIIAKCYEMFKKSFVVKGLMLGLKSTVVGLIAATVISVGFSVLFPAGFTISTIVSSTLTTANFWFSLGVFAVMLFLLLYKKLNPILIIGISAALGIVAGYAGLITV